MLMHRSLLFTCLVLYGAMMATLIAQERFVPENELLLMHFDCKTDVDDVHSAAALAMLMSAPGYQDFTYHTVAGTYGIREGLYVASEELFEKSLCRCRSVRFHGGRDQKDHC